MYNILFKYAPNLKKKVNLIYLRQFHYTTQMSEISVIYPTGLDKIINKFYGPYHDSVIKVTVN
jgi:hypothetical protein